MATSLQCVSFVNGQTYGIICEVCEGVIQIGTQVRVGSNGVWCKGE